MKVNELIFGVTRSVSGKNIRLTLKQWSHITESHNNMAGNVDKIMETVNSPDFIVESSYDRLMAVKFYPKTSIGKKHCIVIYKETNNKGLIITAYLTKNIKKIEKRGIKWRK